MIQRRDSNFCARKEGCVMNKYYLSRVALGIIAILAVALLVGSGTFSSEPQSITLSE